MYEYKLETHLCALCAQYPRYANLNSTWTLNKHSCSELLKSVVIRYPHFSMHDASHAEAVVSKMEMLLGSRIEKLSPTDTWLLLHAAYAHDLGMVVQWSEIEDVWEQPEFKSYLDSLASSGEPELREAAAFFRTAKDTETDQSWPLKAYRYVSLVNASYFRGRHARISRRYIEADDRPFDLDFGHSGLIQPRLIKLLGRICTIHTEPLEKVLDLDYQTNGFDSDYAHPRFVAMLLRLGDLLDIDNGRFNTGVELSFGSLPATSVPHKEKHEATTHLLVTPTEIRFRSDCPDSGAYLEARQFVSWLEAEVDFLTKYWSKIAPEDLGGYAPCFDHKELLINGVPDIEGVAGLKFEISQDKAFQIIEGSNIYEDPFVFIREVIQNAMDASKLQLWKDLTSGTYQAWIGTDETETLQPYDLDQKIYESYPIQVRLSTLPDQRVRVEVADRGTGISVDSFKRMCSVGTSNSGPGETREMIRTMPNWLRPTAGFGIGLQSIFLLADQFEIDTSTGNETFHAVVHSRRAGGYLQLQRTEQQLPRGTTIRIQFAMPENFRFSFGGETSRYLEYQMDPIGSENHTGEVRVLEAIRTNCANSMFPIHVMCGQEVASPLDIMSRLPVASSGWQDWKNRYRYEINGDGDLLRLWDTRAAAYGEFRFVPRGYRASRFRFKGMEVSKRAPGWTADGVSATLDAYGLDTREAITLDRSALTRAGARQVSELFREFVSVFIDLTLKHLEDAVSEAEGKFQVKGRFDPYSFWRLCDQERRQRIPSAVIETIRDQAMVIVRNKLGKFEAKRVPVLDLLPRLQELPFVNLDGFHTLDSPVDIDYARICDILNSGEKIGVEQIIADRTLKDAVRYWPLRTLECPVPGSRLWLYTISDSDAALIDVQGDSRAAVLRGLGRPISGMSYNHSSREDRRAKRYAIPALEEYRTLAVKGTPYGIAEPGGLCVYWILSPFVQEEEDRRSGLSREEFLELVMGSDVFPNVVEYVARHSIHETTPTEEQIRADYRRLIGDYYDVMHNVQEEDGEELEDGVIVLGGGQTDSDPGTT